MTDRSPFSHIDRSSQPHMVDVSAKPATSRMARAEAIVQLGADLARRLAETGAVAKGNVLATARIAGIMAAKRTADLIPMCHSLVLDHIDVQGEIKGDRLTLTSSVRCSGRTGVEMEALTAVTVAALVVYDMCKSATKALTIGPIRLLAKSGGKTGSWKSADPLTE